MARLIILTVCLISALVVQFVECSTIPEAFESTYGVNVAQNMTDFLKANPGITLQELDREEQFDEVSNKIQIVHRFGARVDGDRQMAKYAQRYEFATLQDYKVQLSYPASGASPGPYTINYLLIVVGQSSTLSRAYLLYGGIGQNKISVVVESQQTTYFAFEVTVFGY